MSYLQSVENLMEGPTVGDVPRINIELPAELHRRLKIRAVEEGTTLRELVVRLLDDAQRRPRSAKRRG